MSRNDYAFRRLVDAAGGLDVRAGVALEVDDAGHRFPLILTAMRPSSATTLRLSVDEGRQLFDAIAEALATIESLHATAAIAAARDTPADPGTTPLSFPSARV